MLVSVWFQMALLYMCSDCSGTRMLGMVITLFGLLDGEMRRRGLVKCPNPQFPVVPSISLYILLFLSDISLFSLSVSRFSRSLSSLPSYFSFYSGQPPLITKPPELDQVKGKVVVPKQKIQQVNEHDTRSKTVQLKSISNKSLGSPEARSNSDTPHHFTPLKEQRKKADVAPVTEDKFVKHSKGNKTSAGSKKQKQGFNYESQIEIEPDSETDQPDQLA
ncbi:MAG: hypothetical protein EZS28_042502 [Streblomastix strix]|uniref:Uncharacterized protein n=1 Tax=Streblomastix strix TaxID=222440 RepID=A0A5J4TVR2_9EUKA|nr:MAG: hypothetical protein EZS28_042502 [Streblomastix strix]